MKKPTIGVVDYGLGNHNSVLQTLSYLNLRCRISDDYRLLEACDLLLLPGVGAFRPAMQALQRTGLDRFLLDQVECHKPILGICLGMQLLGNSSLENGWTAGLGFIPSDVVPLETGSWHIGWNTLISKKADSLFEVANKEYFYFNHSYAYRVIDKFVVCSTTFGNTQFPSVVRSGKVIGLQFHPEKSQQAGRVLLRSIIGGLCSA